MVRLILLIAILGTALIIWYKIKIAGPKLRKKVILWSVIGSLGGVLLLLALSGHLNLITAVIAGALAMTPRLLQFTKYIPFIQQRFRSGRQRNDQNQQPVSPDEMNASKQQAYKILGLKPGCSREAIITAHRRIMQKVHPDRGGSDYLAAQINQAKDMLLG